MHYITMTKVIHQIWFQGSSNVPEKYHANLKANIDLNKTWVHHLWDSQDIRDACRRFSPEALRAHDACEHMHQKIDLGRYMMLYHHGGMSIDMDARCVRPLDEFLPLVPEGTDIVLSETSMPTWLLRLYGTRFNNAQIYCPRPHSQFIKYVILECIRRILDLSNAYTQLRPYETIQYTTGPTMFFDVYRTVSTMDIPIFQAPSMYFEPCSTFQDQCNITPETFIYHEMHQTWVSTKEKTIIRVIRAAIRGPARYISILVCLGLSYLAISKGTRVYGKSLLWFLFGFLFHGLMVVWNDERFAFRSKGSDQPNFDILHRFLPRLGKTQNSTVQALLIGLCIISAIFVFFHDRRYASVYLQMMALTLFVRGVLVVTTVPPKTDIQMCTKMTTQKMFGSGCNDKWISLAVVSLVISLIMAHRISRGQHSMVFSVLAVTGSMIPILTRQHYTTDVVMSYLWVVFLWSDLLPFQGRLP